MLKPIFDFISIRERDNQVSLQGRLSTLCSTNSRAVDKKNPLTARTAYLPLPMTTLLSDK